ncbi:MAG: hypothetical protein HGA31_04405 [Candidatus Moranbacteria bacterium]|nr:hypothetical protein [Candidatus Moranbacteria bacterium]
MDILFYETHHSLPSFSRPRQPKEKFDLTNSGNRVIVGNWKDKWSRPLRETLFWPVLRGISMIEYPATIAHIAAFNCPYADASERMFAERISVLITNRPKSENSGGIPVIVDQNGNVTVDVLWTDSASYVSDSLRSARSQGLKNEDPESYRWYYYFVDQLGKAKESAALQVETARRTASIYEAIP